MLPPASIQPEQVLSVYNYFWDCTRIHSNLCSASQFSHWHRKPGYFNIIQNQIHDLCSSVPSRAEQTAADSLTNLHSQHRLQRSTLHLPAEGIGHFSSHTASESINWLWRNTHTISTRQEVLSQRRKKEEWLIFCGIRWVHRVDRVFSVVFFFPFLSHLWRDYEDNGRFFEGISC